MSSISANQLKWIEVSRSKLEHNIQVIRTVIGPEKYLMGVVKANSYGNGTSLVARPLLNAGVDCFGVVTLEEAKDLRNQGIRVPIFVLGYISPGKADEVIRYNLTPIVFSLDFVKALEAIGEAVGKTNEVTVKIETGMNRHGLHGRKLREVMDFLAGAKYVKVTGFSTHFAKSDDPDSEATLGQLKILNKAINTYRDSFGLFQSHAANSAATLLYPEAHLQMVRCGLIMYGLYPSPFVTDSYKGDAFKPIMEFKARIVQLRTVQKGESVSYGGTWVATEKTDIAVLPVGYSDGYRRDLSSCGHVIIKGKKAPILGRICMNLLMVDVSDIDGTEIGDIATLISIDPASGCTANHIAAQLETINYEIVSGLSASIERLLVD